MGSVSGLFILLNFYVNNFIVLMIVCVFIVFGGLGFFVVFDIVRKRRFLKLNVYFKVVLFLIVIFIFVGVLFIFFIEFN